METSPTQCQMHEQRISAIETKLETGNVVLESINQNLTKLNKVLIDGNGQPSLVTRHELLASAHETHLKMHKETKDDAKWTVGNIISIIIAIAAAIISIKSAS